MARVYSTRFFHSAVTNAYVVYVVPPGKRAVVRHAVAVNYGTDAGKFTLQGAGAVIWAVPLPGGGATSQVELRAVVNAGEQLTGYMAATSGHCYLSGYLFDVEGTVAEDEWVIVPGPPPPVEPYEPLVW